MSRRRRPAAPVRPPTAIATWIIELALRRLPFGEVRTRYQREFTAELYGMTPRRQLRHSLGVLGTAASLRHAVHAHPPTIGESTMTLVRPTKALGCRLNIWHKWVRHSTEDGARYLTCARCGKDRSDDGGNVLPGAPGGPF